jgi:hypothetical protein
MQRHYFSSGHLQNDAMQPVVAEQAKKLLNKSHENDANDTKSFCHSASSWQAFSA